MDEFGTEKQLTKFDFDYKKGVKNELGCTKISNKGQTQG